MVLKPEKEKQAEAIFRKWGLDFAVVGYTTPSKRFVVKHGGDVMADLPIKELGVEAPLFVLPHVAAPPLPVEPAAPTSASTYSPAPSIGESPTRPGIFQDNPEVVVVAEMSPLASTAMQGIVPVRGCAMTSSA